MKKKKPFIGIIGAGPSGLGCAYELLAKLHTKNNQITVWDKNSQVGGLARTYRFKGLYFDVGPHRFYTKNREVQKLWEHLLGTRFRKVSRLTRILYKNKLFFYPVQLKDALMKLGIKDSAVSLLSYVQAKIFLRRMKPKTFEDWITKNFGKKLFSIFFKTYTEKVWGISCKRIGEEWAAQRIKNLNFFEVLKTAIFGERARKAKSLVDTFYYPVHGAGSMYEKMSSVISKKGADIQLDSRIVSIRHDKKTIKELVIEKNNRRSVQKVDYVFASMPLTHFVEMLDPLPPKKILDASRKLFYRDHLTVNVTVNGQGLFPDNWIYVHAPEVKMARVANYNNFVRREKPGTRGTTALSVEYFVFQKDRLWKMKDNDLIALAKKELQQVGLVKKVDIRDGFVVRETESYPTYYLGHREYFELLKSYVESFSNLQLIGRGGMFKYNNMDHAIYSGMLAARNYVSGTRTYDVWSINEDAEYLEEKR